MAESDATTRPEVVFENNGDTQLKEYGLPETVYSVFLVMHFLDIAPSQKTTNCLLCQLWFLWAVNLIYQFMFIYWVYDMIQEGEEGVPVCGDHKVELIARYMAIALFTAYMLGDLYESYDMTVWMRHMSDYDSPEKQLSHPDGEADLEDKSRSFHMRFFNSSTCMKLWLFVSVIVPKIVIAAMIWFLGATFTVMPNDLTDVIFNSLTLGFITSVDECFYEFCCGEDMRDCVANGVTNVTIANRRTWSTTTAPFVQMLVMAFSAVGLTSYNCGWFK